MKYVFVFVFSCWGLWGCSSSGFRAPVADLTVNSSQTAATRTISKSASSAGKLKSYKVKAGDTLYAIAWETDLDVQTLAKRNNLKSPYIIYKGQILNLTEEKQRKYQPTLNKIKKSTPPSQKIDKKSPIPCTGQNCVKNNKQKLVEKKTKAYSANTVAQRAAPEAKKHKVKGEKITAWLWPAEGKLTKSFAASQAGMKGISISNRRGTAIYAAASGQVVYAGSGLRGYGRLIIIKHNYDYLSAYAHNEKLLVHENEQIKEGQKIAIMGDSGTDSVHLHFEIRYRGKSVDPLRYLEKR